MAKHLGNFDTFRNKEIEAKKKKKKKTLNPKP
jgi:hypothetical protein